MSDSFFGFSTTLPGDDDDDGLNRDDEDSEYEYDALNDETFGSAIKGDWEDLHQNLVKLERTVTHSDDDENNNEDNNHNDNSLTRRLSGQNHSSRTQQHHKDVLRNDFHSLEQDLLRLGLRNLPAAPADDDCESRISLDPSVWAPPTPGPPPIPRSVPNTGPGHGGMFGGGNFPAPPRQLPPMMTSGGGGGGPKMCTLEDIERNMRSGGGGGGQSNGHLMDSSQTNSRDNSTNNNHHPHHHNDSMRHMFHQQQQQHQNRGPGGPGGPLNAPSRLPPGFGPSQQPPGPPGPVHLPPSMGNNFGPPFPPLNRPGPPMFPMMGGPGGPHGPPPPPGPNSGPPHSPNHYNKRLVMEIQQTHPLLGYHRMNHPHGMHPLHGHPVFMQQQQQMQQQQHNGGLGPMGMGPPGHGMPPHPMQQQNHMMNGGSGGPGGMPMKQRGYSPMGMTRGDGNLSLTRQLMMNGGGGGTGGGNPDEEIEVVRDEYRNLMTPRDKQWLIGIQLMQLNTETPYIDDYYYTVYKERRREGRRENKCHTDNQLNHPFSQPQGHAQLVLQSIGNRNTKGVFGNNRENNSGGGGGGRDRKGSESRNGNEKNENDNKQQQQQTPRTYTPLQFENSLGKLQCGSVTAPRKIIDMEVVAQEANASTGAGGLPLPPAMELTAQRKCRQMLLHIETLYRVVLKLEDLTNPTAIEAFALLKEKRERERKAALEAQQQAEREKEREREAANEGVTDATNATTTATTNSTTAKVVVGGGRLNIDSVLGEDKSRMGEETLEELLRVLVAGLVPEKVIGMMSVRKGRTLLTRAMAQVENVATATSAWMGVVIAAPMVLKKDRAETEVQLFALCRVLKKHVTEMNLTQLLGLGQVLETRAEMQLGTKFGAAALVLLVHRAEDLFVTAKGSIDMADRQTWNKLLSGLCTAAAVVTEGKELQPPSAKRLEVLEKVIAHLLRFPDLDKSQALLKALSSHPVDEL